MPTFSPPVGTTTSYSTTRLEHVAAPMASSLDLAVALWGVVGQGILTGKFHRAADPAKPEDSTRAPILGHKVTKRNLAIARLADEIGQEAGLTPTQVALNWARSRGQQMIPVLGARTPAPRSWSLTA